MHTLNSASVDTNNDEHDVKLELKMLTTCYKWAELQSIKRLIKTFRMCIRFIAKSIVDAQFIT
jgi:hypothetical protein